MGNRLWGDLTSFYSAYEMRLQSVICQRASHEEPSLDDFIAWGIPVATFGNAPKGKAGRRRLMEFPLPDSAAPRRTRTPYLIRTICLSR